MGLKRSKTSRNRRSRVEMEDPRSGRLESSEGGTLKWKGTELGKLTLEVGIEGNL